MDKEKLIQEYKKLKEDMDNERNSETLRKFKILNAAFDLGKKIHGAYFNQFRLAKDFEISHNTVKRILSLRRANEKTWEKINSGKITSFKAAMVLMQKNNHLQDKLIDFVIEEKLSTYRIEKLKEINSLEDIKANRLQLAVEEGFAREDVAYISFSTTIRRLQELLLLKPKYLPEKKIPELKDKLEKSMKMIDSYIKALENTTE